MGEKEKEKKKTLDYKDDNITMHQKFDKIIDEYYSDLKDEREIREKTVYKKGDHIFKSVERSGIDYARLDENDGAPNFCDLLDNEPKFGTVKIDNPLPKVEKRNELRKSYMCWLQTEKLMKPNERRLDHEHMQEKYLETIKLSRDIKNDIKLARVIKSHYPRGIVGVDSMYSENTVLYKEKYDEMKHKKDIVDKRRKEREGALEKQNAKNGNILAHETND
ncbi:conserved Plasmodium protein, unknown function [Plasmodium chabaudi chabaudi]|uniref:Uncharacterized protein n=1 Tax=Plasmodium chabaudi chabaudi TaxID=31271 RepID=A0A1C6YDS6_PLACU|nr:conserved Plasmodium protein, unknown function [Plasmodium chabaudi chabaudi]